MNNKDFIAKLQELDACGDAVKWVGDRDLKTAWEQCERVDWMLWLAYKLELGTRAERIHVTCDCAETALQYVSAGEERPRLAILAARKYADNPTEENRAAAWAAGAAGAAARDAAWAAWDAAWAAGDAARAAAWAAGAAARAAAGDAAWAAAGDAAWAAAHLHMCKIIRDKITL